MLNNSPPQGNIFIRAIRWIFASEIRALLVIAIAFFLYLSFKVLGFTFGVIGAFSIESIISLFIFSVFLGAVIVTDSSRKYKSNGELKRAICGAITGLTIGLIYWVSVEMLFLMALVGVILGTFGRKILDGL